MGPAILFDCEFLTAEGAPSRFWCGPYDPDPVVVQIGAVKIGLEGDFPLEERLCLLVKPTGRNGGRLPLDPFFTRLTGVTEGEIDRDGLPLPEALARLADFAGNATLWSWGKDEFNMLAISCYVAGIAPPLPVTRFGNACHLLLRAGMPYADLKTTRSDRLSAYYGLDHPPLRGHDALDDALSVAYVAQHLLRTGALAPADFAVPAPVPKPAPAAAPPGLDG